MKTISNAICAGCNLLCDDITFEVSGQKISTDVACDRCQSWTRLANQSTVGASGAGDRSEKVRRLADGLLNAQSPLIAGIGNLTLQGQQLACKIADVCNACIDVSVAPSNQSSLNALQRQGKVTASLGEIDMRGDLIVFWFCDPVTTHPRLLERLQRKGSKKIVVVDDQRTATATVADEFIQVEQTQAVEFLGYAHRHLRSIGQSQDTAHGHDEIFDGGNDGMGQAAVGLVKLMCGSQCGSLFYGHVADSAIDSVTTLTHQKIVRELNNFTRWFSVALRDDANGLSAENVMAALSGYPTALSYAQGIPQYQGTEFSAAHILERGLCDFVLLFAGSAIEKDLAALSPAARAHWDGVCQWVISSGALPQTQIENAIPIGMPGYDASGEYCRVDDVTLPLRQIVETDLPADHEVLAQLFEHLVASGGD